MPGPPEGFEVATDRDLGGAFFPVAYAHRLQRIIIELKEAILQLRIEGKDQHAQLISAKWQISALEMEIIKLEADAAKVKLETIPGGLT